MSHTNSDTTDISSRSSQQTSCPESSIAQSSHFYSASKGELLHDRYQINKLVGFGRFSKVYHCTDTVSKETVAVKIYRASSEFYSYFCNETNIIEAFNGERHPNVITALDNFVLETEDVVHGCIVMEFVDTTLKDVLNELDGIKWADVKQIVCQIAEGLHFLHSHGVIHGDIKPENLLVDLKNQVIKVCDVGSGVKIGEIETFRIGTVPYLAPELILGLDYGPAIDIWSLGCLAFELVCNECPFDPDMYFRDDNSVCSSDAGSSHHSTDSDRQDDNHDKPDDEESECDQSISMSSSDDSGADGFEWQINFFTLAVFRAVLGPVPEDPFRKGEYWSLYYNSHGRLRCVPRCIDKRSLSAVLVEDFEQDETIANEVEKLVIFMLHYMPEARPTARQLADHLKNALVSQQSP